MKLKFRVALDPENLGWLSLRLGFHVIFDVPTQLNRKRCSFPISFYPSQFPFSARIAP